MDAPVDWAALRAAARTAAAGAYAPYSGFRVGAAGVTADGRLVTGCNVENLSYGLSLCAECGLVSSLHATGGGRLVAVAVVSGSGEPCPPCGRCRQLLLEHGGPGCLVDGDGTPRTVDQLLPGGFSAERLREG
jgi:cytidine deaminase